MWIGLWVLSVLMMMRGTVVTAQDNGRIDVNNYERTMQQMIFEVVNFHALGEFNLRVFQLVNASNDPLYIAPLLDVGYFTLGSNDLHFEINRVLSHLTGQPFGPNWTAYFNWAGENDIATPPGYDAFKGRLLATLIDEDFQQFLYPGVEENARINLAEIVWGGVAVDGIPSLVNARQITPQAAMLEGETLPQYCREDDCRYPAPDELVFGVSINGDNRAYPLRVLNWHEMFNDVIGFAPLYDAPGGDALCNFRAPIVFDAIARDGDAWVNIIGTSPGCPVSDGWLAVDAVEWLDSTWDDVRPQLPDTNDGDIALWSDVRVAGRVVGQPIMLAYCTLCGSGVLYNPVIDDLVVDGESLGTVALEFGSTGLLMRSNKLMYDRTTFTVWNQMTGEPVVGKLVDSGIQLERLPVVVTDWATWLDQHPDTSVLSLDTGYRRNYENGAAYADYFNRAELMFPVWQQNTEQFANKDVVYTLLLNDTPKAYPLEYLIPEQVTNDVLAGTNLVLVSRETPQRDFFEPGGASVRAYQRGDHSFAPGASPFEVVDERGVVWAVTEDALVSPDGDSLPRLPGSLAFWFGWYGFFPETQVYQPA